MSFESESVNENVFFVKGKVHKKLKIYELDDIFAEYDKLFKK